MKNKKSLGQHWLYNREILEEIADLAIYRGENRGNSGACNSSEKVELCVEIGPGLGTLTSSLLRRFDKVIAVEYDTPLATNLPNSFPGKNLEVVNEDILRYDFSKIKEPYVVVGNIPYYITSPIIERLLTVKNSPEKIVLLVQKEVAERIGDNKETMLSLFVKNRAKVFLGLVVKKEEFAPPPKVDSQVIILEPKKPEVTDSVFDLVKIGFSAPRKKLIHNLASICSREKLEDLFGKVGLGRDVRPGDLGLADWKKMYQELRDFDK